MASTAESAETGVVSEAWEEAVPDPDAEPDAEAEPWFSSSSSFSM